MNAIKMGHLLRTTTTDCVVGCRVAESDTPRFGEMVRIPLNTENGYQIYGLVYDISIQDDGLVRQLVTAGHVTAEIVEDNRQNRSVPLEVGVLFIGYQEQNKIFHLLPPRPPLSLDEIYICENEEICKFTDAHHFGYMRQVLRRMDIPVGELLAAHLKQAGEAHGKGSGWPMNAAQELITLLRDDYSTLMSVLGALADTGLNFEDNLGGNYGA